MQGLRIGSGFWSALMRIAKMQTPRLYAAFAVFAAELDRVPSAIHDLHATILHLLGIQHEQLTHRHVGRDFRLTDVAGKVVRGMLA